jgi:hypothetical protein
MATLNDMVDEVKQSLSGYTHKQERINFLNTAISSTDTVLELGMGTNLAKGVIEIDEELLYAISFNTQNNSVTLAPGFGRGYDGTNAAAHAQYAKVVFSPTFPYNAVKRAINDTIVAVFPKLFAVDTYTFSYNAATNTYALPDDVDQILEITWSTLGSSKEWLPVRRWRADKNANISAFNSRKSLTIYDPIGPGRTVQVHHTLPPLKLENSTDDFSLVSGLPESCRDVITWGAAYRLAAYQDAGRISQTSPEADLIDTKVPTNASQQLSRFLFSNFQLRLTEEAEKLKDDNPVRLHYTN